MLQDVAHPPEQLPIDGITSPIAAQILGLCDDDELFSEALRGSDVSSCSGATECGGTASGSGAGGSGSLCCYDDNFGTTFPQFSAMNPTSLSALLESEPPPDCEPHIAAAAAAAASYSSSGNPPASAFQVLPYISDQQDQLDQIMLSEAITSGYPSSYCSDMAVPPMQLQSLPSVYEDECLPPLPMAYVGLDPTPSCTLLEPGLGSYYPGSAGIRLTGDAQGLFSRGVIAASGLARTSSQELVQYQRADGGGVRVLGPDSIQSVYNTADMQVMAENRRPPALQTSEMSVLDDSTFKVGRLSVEERKEKIHRYMKKRNERNFSKKIKYACRKTLADSRPRVRGRFARNDELGEAARPNSVQHEFEEDEEVMVKDEDLFDSSDILAHISGVNSFKYNYTIESWI